MQLQYIRLPPYHLNRGDLLSRLNCRSAYSKKKSARVYNIYVPIIRSSKIKTFFIVTFCIPSKEVCPFLAKLYGIIIIIIKVQKKLARNCVFKSFNEQNIAPLVAL